MSSGIRYRPDVDGLRAVAVVPVVLFHAGLPLFSGGYVGVDVFFVISGYLITAILLADIGNDAFSIANFYARRIRRIFPALLVVLAATTLAAWVLFMPERLVDYGHGLLSVSVFGSNFHFWKSVDYFSTNAHVQPLLHTWSLAVEEQFYIFYPLLLFVVSRTRLKLPLVLLAGGVVSLAAAAVLLAVMPGAVFYLLPFRAWELVLGGILAAGYPAPPENARASLAASLLGAALMIGPMVLYESGTPFPGLAAVPPALGAALLIWSGASARTPVHRLLSTAPFVLVGKASYSFYLWHFPLFAVAAYLLNRPLDRATGLALAAVALIAAFATLFLLENPVRRSRTRASIAVPLALMVLAGVIGFTLSRSEGYSGRLAPAAGRLADAAADKSRHPLACMTTQYSIVSPERACRMGAPGKAPVALLWGDSHAMVTATAMDAAARRAGASFLFAAAADCPPGLGFSISPKYEAGLTNTPGYRFCDDYNNRMLELALREPAVRAVVISARWSNWRIGEPANPVENPVDVRLVDAAGTAGSSADNARIFEAGFRRLVTRLRQAGKAVYIVGPLPEPAFDVPQTLFVSRYGLSEESAPIPLSEFYRRHRRALRILDRAALIPGVRMIWPHRLLCRTGQCPIIVDGEPVYFDHNHLSVSAAVRTSGLYSDVFAR